MVRYEPRSTRDTARYSTATKPASLQPTPTRAIQRDLIQRLMADPTQATPEALQLLRESQGEAFVQRLIEHPTVPIAPANNLNSFLTQISTNRAKLTVQPKLTVTPAGDQYEQEADAVAEQVVQRINAPTPAPAVQRDHEDDKDKLQMMRDAGFVQRQPEEDKDKLQMMRLQRQTGDVMGGLDVDAGVESRIQAARGSGSPIAEGSRAKLESAFGADFSGVRVHTDSESDTLNRSVQARAFTTGQDIFFRQGEYSLGSSDGQKLLAHELTHVVQQNGAQISQNAPIQSETTFQNVDSQQQSAGSSLRRTGDTRALQRQVLSNIETADGDVTDPLHFYIIDVIIGGRSPSPFSNTMGAHSTAWVAHIDAVRRSLIRKDIRDALDALLGMANEDLDNSNLLPLADVLKEDAYVLKLTGAKESLQGQIDTSDNVLTELSEALNSSTPLSPTQKVSGISAIKKLIDKYLTYVNYLPSSTVRGGDPSGHGEGSARGNLNLFEYMYAAQKSGSPDLSKKQEALGNKGFAGLVNACTQQKFQAGTELNTLKQALIEELWTMFATETPGIFSKAHDQDAGKLWVLMLKNFLKTVSVAYPYTYTITQMHVKEHQLLGLNYALKEANIVMSLEDAKSILLEIEKTPVMAAPRADYGEVAESDFKSGGTGFKATILLTDDNKIGSIEMIGRTQSPFKGTMGAHTTAWIAHLDAIRNLLSNKTVDAAIKALQSKCQKVIDDPTLRIFNQVEEQQQEFIIQGITNTKIANSDADKIAQPTVQLHEQVAFLEWYIFQYLSLVNFLPLSTIQTPSVPGGRSEGKHRQFLKNFEENPIVSPNRDIQKALIDHLRGLYDPSGFSAFPPSKYAQEGLVFHGSDEAKKLSQNTYEDIKLVQSSKKPRREDIHRLAQTRFIETILEAYPHSCAAIKTHPYINNNIYDLIA